MSKRTFLSKRASFYADVPDEKWSNWRWQLSNRLNTVDEFDKVVPLTDSEKKPFLLQVSSGSISPRILRH
jgi:lysine 2,3-aminomutase